MQSVQHLAEASKAVAVVAAVADSLSSSSSRKNIDQVDDFFKLANHGRKRVKCNESSNSYCVITKQGK